MSKRAQTFRILAVTGAAALALIFGSAFFADTPGQQDVRGADVAPLDGPAETPVHEVVADDRVQYLQSPPAPRLPLPPADAPLIEQIEALDQLARAGDPAASCRLIIASNRCGETLRNARFTAQARAAIEKRPTDLVIDMVATSELQSSDDFCAGIKADDLPDLQSTFARALPFLTPRQKTLLALMRPDGRIRRIQFESRFSESGLYVLPQFLADNTRTLLMDGYAAMDPLALEGLVLLHAPGTSLAPRGAGVWLPNPREFYRFARLMQELFGPESVTRNGELPLRSVNQTLSPSEIAQLEGYVMTQSSRWRERASDAIASHKLVNSGSDANLELSSCP